MSADDHDLDRAAPAAPIALRWALLAWPPGWREAYGEEMAESWLERGGRRHELLGLAAQGCWRRLTAPRPTAPGPRTAAGPPIDGPWTRPGPVALSAVLTLLALTMVPTFSAAGLEAGGLPPDAAVALGPLLQIAAGVTGWVLTQRARDVVRRSWASGLMVGAALTVLALTVLGLPLLLLAGLAGLVGSLVG